MWHEPIFSTLLRAVPHTVMFMRTHPSSSPSLKSLYVGEVLLVFAASDRWWWTSVFCPSLMCSAPTPPDRAWVISHPLRLSSSWHALHNLIVPVDPKFTSFLSWVTILWMPLPRHSGAPPLWTLQKNLNNKATCKLRVSTCMLPWITVCAVSLPLSQNLPPPLRLPFHLHFARSSPRGCFWGVSGRRWEGSAKEEGVGREGRQNLIFIDALKPQTPTSPVSSIKVLQKFGLSQIGPSIDTFTNKSNSLTYTVASSFVLHVLRDSGVVAHVAVTTRKRDLVTWAHATRRRAAHLCAHCLPESHLKTHYRLVTKLRLHAPTLDSLDRPLSSRLPVLSSSAWR